MKINIFSSLDSLHLIPPNDYLILSKDKQGTIISHIELVQFKTF